MVAFQLFDLRSLLVKGVEKRVKPGAVGYLEPERAVTFPSGIVLVERERRDGLVDRDADRVEVSAELGDAPRVEVRLAAPDGCEERTEAAE